MKVKVLDPNLLSLDAFINTEGVGYSSLITKKAISDDMKPIDMVSVRVGEFETLCSRDKLEIIGTDDNSDEACRNNFEILKNISDLYEFEGLFAFHLVCEIIKNEFDAVTDIILYSMNLSEARPFGKEPAIYGTFVKSMCEELKFPLIEVKKEANHISAKWSNSYARLEGVTEDVSYENWDMEHFWYIRDEYDCKYAAEEMKKESSLEPI